jgi:hypothetical protein
VREENDERALHHHFVEGIMTGLGYACGLVVLGVFAVGSFRPAELANPYWDRLGGLRTDTLGALCFVVGTVAFATSEYLRLSRCSGTLQKTAVSTPEATTVVTAIARALTVAATGLVVYLSVNAVTHPRTLTLSATHLLPWPSESTLRVAALVIAAYAAAVARTQGIRTTKQNRIGHNQVDQGRVERSRIAESRIGQNRD